MKLATHFAMRNICYKHALKRNQLCKTILASLLDLHLKVDNTDQIIYHCLSQFAMIFQTRRSYLFLFRNSGEKMDLTHEWCVENVFAEKENLQNIDPDQIPWLNTRLKDNNIIQISNIYNLSPEMKKVRDYLYLHGNQTVIFPVKTGAVIEGFVGFDMNDTVKLWDEYKVILSIIADIIGNALLRSRQKILFENGKKDAEIRAQQKSDFANYISHEIRNPLTSIQSIVEVIEKSNLDNAQIEYMNVLKQAVSALLAIVNQALEYSRSESGSIMLEQVSFDLYTVITNWLEIYKEKARQKGLVLNSEISEIIPDQLIGDPSRLCQIIGNLVDNSIKYTQQGSIRLIVMIDSEMEGEMTLRFDIIDTGQGISLENLSRLFQRFSQLDLATAHKYGGSGLGLSICKNLVELMGGMISVDSEPGKGSKFSFTAKFKRNCNPDNV